MNEANDGDGPTSPGDAELEALLKDALGNDAPPTAQAEFAIAAFSLPRLDDALAELVYDSTSETALAGVRSAPEQGLHLTFTQDEISIDVEWEVDNKSELTGQVDSLDHAVLTVHRLDASESVAVDGHGEFLLRGVLPGPMRLTCQAGSRRLETDWFRL